jgi:hypothetical protein
MNVTVFTSVGVSLGYQSFVHAIDSAEDFVNNVPYFFTDTETYFNGFRDVSDRWDFQ